MVDLRGGPLIRPGWGGGGGEREKKIILLLDSQLPSPPPSFCYTTILYADCWIYYKKMTKCPFDSQRKDSCTKNIKAYQRIQRGPMTPSSRKEMDITSGSFFGQ